MVKGICYEDLVCYEMFRHLRGSQTIFLGYSVFTQIMEQQKVIVHIFRCAGLCEPEYFQSDAPLDLSNLSSFLVGEGADIFSFHVAK